MPIGNGDVGINAWVESSGDLVFYISKTDAWDENGRLCKIGRVRVTFDPALPVGSEFRQELKLREGVIEIAAGTHRLTLRVDANTPVVVLEADSEDPVGCRAEVELWRLKERPFGADDDSHSGKGLNDKTSPLRILPDVVIESEAPRIVWYHRNTHSIYPLCLTNQNLTALAGRFPDPLLNHTFGAALGGPGLVREGPQALRSAAPARRHVLAVTVLSAKTATADEWLERLDGLTADAPLPSRTAHEAWWNAYWERSWIFVDGDPVCETITRGYVLQRFMNACSGRGGSPIKFNGSLFTVEPKHTDGSPWNADYRKWGDCYWWQNTRLPYGAMAQRGDFEQMRPLFKYYADCLPICRERTKIYYGAEGVYFPETMTMFGLYGNGDYGWGQHATPGDVHCAYWRWAWNQGPELVQLMLDYLDYTDDAAFAKNELVPMAREVLKYFDTRFPRDANGKLAMTIAASSKRRKVA